MVYFLRMGSAVGVNSSASATWSSSTTPHASCWRGSRVASRPCSSSFTRWSTGFTGAATSSATGFCARQASLPAPAATPRYTLVVSGFFGGPSCQHRAAHPLSTDLHAPCAVGVQACEQSNVYWKAMRKLSAFMHQIRCSLRLCHRSGHLHPYFRNTDPTHLPVPLPLQSPAPCPLHLQTLNPRP